MDLHRIFDLQYQASRTQVDVPLLVRRERLLRLQKMLDENGPALCAAVEHDFGVRSERWTEMLDLMLVRNMLRHTLKHLPKWSKRQRVRTPLMLSRCRSWRAGQASTSLRSPLHRVWNLPGRSVRS